MATFTYTKYANLDNPKGPVYDFIANPLTYISHQDQLLEAKKTAAEAYTLRATQETYLII